MSISLLLKPSFTSILVILLITLQISACGLEEAADTNNSTAISREDSGSVTEDVDPDGDNLLEVNGKLNIADANAGEDAFIAGTINGIYGSLTINVAGSWDYAANNKASVIQSLATGATLTDNLTVRSVDNTTYTVIITIVGVDEDSADINIRLAWVAPSERENNEPISLSEIAGYNIYYGTMQDQYNNSVIVNDGTAEDYTFTDLSAGTYYFVVTVYDTSGRESQYSTEIKKVLL